MYNDFCNVYLHSLTHEKDKKFQEEAKDESKQRKERIMLKKARKKKKRQKSQDRWRNACAEACMTFFGTT